MPLHLQEMEVDNKGRYGRLEDSMCRKRYYQEPSSRLAASHPTYAGVVTGLPSVPWAHWPMTESCGEPAPQAQRLAVSDVLLDRLEAAGQPVPATASFLQDSLAVMVMEGLLDQIELMKRQRVTALEQIERTSKRKITTVEELTAEVKRAKYQPSRPVDPPWARMPSDAQFACHEQPAQPVALSSWLPKSGPQASSESLAAVSEPLAGLSLGQRETASSWAPPRGPNTVAVVPRAPTTIIPRAEPGGRTLARNAPAPLVAQPLFGSSALVKSGSLEVIEFPAGIPAQAGKVSMLFLLPVTMLALQAHFPVVVLTTDPHSPKQYDGLVATSKNCSMPEKGKAPVASLSNKSNYGESSSEHEEEAEEGESAVDRFQRVLRNKRIAKKKANRAKELQALKQRSKDEFLGRISDGLGVKVWGPLDIERTNLCFRGALSHCTYYSYHLNTVLLGAEANWAAAYEFSSGHHAGIPASVVYKYSPCSLPCMPLELDQLYKYYLNEHASRCKHITAYLLITELQMFAQQTDESLHDRTMMLLMKDPCYQNLVNPIQGADNLALVERRHIPGCFLHTKEDSSTALRVMHTQDSSTLFDLDQLAQYALIFGRPGLENTYQGIAVDHAYHMHWRTLFGFALCRALCANSAAKPVIMWRMTLVMACPGLYCEAIASYNAMFPDQPFEPQRGPQLELHPVHIPDEFAQNFSDDDVLRVLLHNRIPADWMDHVYTYGVVFLEQQFHAPTMSMDIFRNINDKRMERLNKYGTPSAIPQWDGWREMTKDDHYCLMFKHDKESHLPKNPEANGLYYLIGMDPNQVRLLKRMAAHDLPTADMDPHRVNLLSRTAEHGTITTKASAINVTLTESMVVDMPVVEGPITPPRTESVPPPSTINVTLEEESTVTEMGAGAGALLDGS